MILGLDIGRRSVKLVRVDESRKNEPPRSVRGAARDLDPALEGQAARGAIVKAIRECADELGVGRGVPVAVSVPRAEAVLKNVVLPPVSPEERAKLIRFQAAKDVPFELSEVVLAHGVVGAAGAATGAEAPKTTATLAPVEVNYAAVRTSVLDSLRGIVREAGLLPASLEISTQAAARAARLLAPEVDDAVLVLVGAMSSEIVLLKKGRIAFSRSASVGYAWTESGWLDKLVAEVQRSLRAASGGGAAAPASALAPSWVAEEELPKNLLVAGGGVKDPNVAATLAARLGIPARTLEPLGAPNTATFIVARGLADPRPVAGIPVLDFEGLAAAQDAKNLRQRGIFAGALVAILVVTLIVLGRNELVAYEHEADELEAELKKVKPGVDSVKKLLREVTVAQDWEKKKGRSLDVLLAVAKGLPGDDAYVTRLSWSEGKNILLNGKVKDQEAVDKLLRNIGKQPPVQGVQLDRLSRPEKDAESKGSEFLITVKLRDLAGEKSK
ncbi:MAG: pilus assembly protein PilM [Planctomycetota bacterium]